MRLIDADEILKEACLVKPYYREEVISVEDIERAPTIEAEPVRHGKWDVKQSGWSDYDCVCSECGLSGTPDYNYCSNCGAKMDGDET